MLASERIFFCRAAAHVRKCNQRREIPPTATQSFLPNEFLEADLSWSKKDHSYAVSGAAH